MAETIEIGVLLTISAVLLAWFALSVVNQFNKALLENFGIKDPFALIPNWTFFAPEPGVTDFRLLVQFKKEDHLLGAQEIEIYRSSFLRPLFNPHKLIQKATFDVSQAQLVAISKFGIENPGLMLLPSYISLLEQSLSAPCRNFEPSHLRFIIAESSSSKTKRKNSALFISRWHPYG